MSVDLCADFSNVPAIVFANSRLITEILVRYLKDSLEQGPVPGDVVVGYRGGYLPNERRQIERGLRDGRIRGVVSTNALELGIDIGSLDVAVLAGYPGTIASTWQRMGRAGRRSGTSVAVLVASSTPLDQSGSVLQLQLRTAAAIRYHSKLPASHSSSAR